MFNKTGSKCFISDSLHPICSRNREKLAKHKKRENFKKIKKKNKDSQIETNKMAFKQIERIH